MRFNMKLYEQIPLVEDVARMDNLPIVSVTTSVIYNEKQHRVRTSYMSLLGYIKCEGSDSQSESV